MLNAIIGVRLNENEKRLLQQVCKARGEDVSDFVRRAIKKELASLNYFDKETKKALGVLQKRGYSE
ncbi:MAG: ribbon-helix-helix protein, CopG family [Candidatus Bathyarchaeia archaeon]